METEQRAPEESGDAASTQKVARGSRRRRRVTLAAPPGTDPEPENPLTETRGENENDRQLLADKPPHWG